MSAVLIPNAKVLNKSSTNVSRINAIWNTWLNKSAPITTYVEPPAHRFDTNDSNLPDLIVYEQEPVDAPAWKVVYQGHYGMEYPDQTGPPNGVWDNRRKHVELICNVNNRLPAYFITSIGSWVRFWASTKEGFWPMVFVNGEGNPKPEAIEDPTGHTFTSLDIGNEEHITPVNAGLKLVMS